MNEDKELEEAVIFLKKVAKEYKTYGDLDNPEFEDIMKIVETIEIVLQALENSIPKKKIEKLIDDLYGDENTIYGTIRIIEMLKELLEDK